MKNVTMTLTLMATILTTAACSSDETWMDDWFQEIDDNGGTGASTGSGATAGQGELTTFTVAIDRSSAEPAQTVAEYYPDEEDNRENNTFGTEVHITFSGNSASYTAADGVTVSIDGAHVVASHGSTKGVSYVVTGSTDNGSLTVVGNKKYEVRLSGATIANPDSAALSLLSPKRAFLTLQGGTANVLADGTTTKSTTHKGALYCKGKLLISGSGSLDVTGNYANGIHTADYLVMSQGTNVYVKSTAGHGIKANDGVFINGGILNVEVSAAAAKGINCESNIIISGGRTTVITTGDGTYDATDREAKGSAAIKADSTYTQRGGLVMLKSTGTGGKGLRSSYEAHVTGGQLYVITEGTQYRYGSDSASPKGIKAGTKNVHGALSVSGGSVMVRTRGTGGEGIESKGTLDISGGSVQVSAYDDAINSAADMTVSGGSVVAVSTSNDGLDANGNMHLKGGTIVAFGASGAETGIDIGEQYKLYVDGATFFGIGGRIDASLGSTTQGIISTSGSVSAGSTVTIGDGSTTLATLAMPPYSYSGGIIMASTPGLVSGQAYTLTLGSTQLSVTAQSTLSGSMGGGMQPGGMGGRPGGR